jgi:hypothetical protein
MENRSVMGKIKYGLTALVLASGSALLAQMQWSVDVAPILYQHCTVCHHEGGIGPFSLMTYPQAAVMGPLLSASAQAGTMPPWPPDTEYSNFAHERILSSDEKAALAAWVSEGMPEGDPSLAPPPPVYLSDGFISAIPDLELVMEPHTSAATPFNDDYSCFSIPTGLLQNKKLRAFEVIPGNPEIVHHALVFLDESGNYQTNTNGFCMGPGDGLLGGYTPGALPIVFPSNGTNFNLGVSVPAGSNIVLAMHYPHGSAGEVDQTRVRLWFYDDAVSIREVTTAAVIQNWSFALPPNQETPVSASFSGIPSDVSLLSVFPHMHLLGKSIESYATPPVGDNIPLIRINRWDFHWQSFYSLENLVRIPAGSTIHGNGVFDNTASNPNNPSDPPQWVGPGEGTNDEMFMIYFQYLPYQQGDELVDLEPLIQMPTTVESIGSKSSESRLAVAPNPASDQIWFSYIANGSERVGVYIYDASGRLVDRLVDGAVQNGEQRIAYPVNDLAPGIYVASARFGERLESVRFVVQ